MVNVLKLYYMDYNKRIKISPFKSIKPIDILGGEFSFGQRLAIAEALQKNKTFDVFKNCIKALHNIKPAKRHVKKLYNYFSDILLKTKVWVEREKTLKYQPSPEEKQAGISNLNDMLKEFGQIDAIAVRMRIKHDEVLQMPYSTVFMIMRKDLEQAKFERRLQKIYEQKSL
jgi:hypothetical protein